MSEERSNARGAERLKPPRAIFIVSDATGETAQRVVEAALIHFGQPGIEVRRFARVRDRDTLGRVIEEAADRSALLVYTLADVAERNYIARRAAELGVEAIDPVGPLVGKLAQVLDREPSGRPGALQSVDEAYFRRIAAMEFAVRHDDGQMPHGLRHADLVLVGISRTGKTPLSTYLAQRGWKVANVPIVLGIPLPTELDTVDPYRIYGLTIDLASLIRIRRARLRQLNMPLDSDYGVKEHIVKELKYAREIFRAHPVWPILDVSNKAIEETASIIQTIAEARAEALMTPGPREPDAFSGYYNP